MVAIGSRDFSTEPRLIVLARLHIENRLIGYFEGVAVLCLNRVPKNRENVIGLSRAIMTTAVIRIHAVRFISARDR